MSDIDRNRKIEARTKESTTERHSDIPAARILEYAEYDEDEKIVCPVCGWSGPASDGDQEVHEALFDVSCPRCDKMLLVVGL